MPLIMPWDAERLETTARRADLENVGRAATPYRRAGERVRSSLLGAMTAANPTRGAAGSRSAAIAAAPELSRLAEAGADATNAARAQATANMIERDRARSENAAQLLGLGLNAGGAVAGMLTSGLGGIGGGAPTAAPAAPGGGLGSLLGAAAPIAGTALGGPLGGMAGGALGSMVAAPMASSLAPARPAPLGGFAPGTRRDAPLGVAAPIPTAPIAGGAPAPHLPPTVGLTPPTGSPMSDAEWAAADEEARRVRARLGY